MSVLTLQRVKICGITHPDQGIAIARCGATALGFICVPSSPRFITVDRIADITTALHPIELEVQRSIDRIGVFANADLETIIATVTASHLTGVQLHGTETPDDCQRLRAALPELELIKAFRIRDRADLTSSAPTALPAYTKVVDTLLLDAYHPDQLGGTGQTLDWASLEAFTPERPWFLAGGLTPDNVSDALTRLHPTGIDLSSGVERSPGDKDLHRVAQLFQALR
ncbi:MAG: phosphoribosylanthranilate isomerase [Oscillatoriales cyanobacterium]|jgi:phosphoribosylanthranilate isomerase|nr:MAG: phosphoribosylanthranilate isomerase [Oscillatoriales cyanobacterium]